MMAILAMIEPHLSLSDGAIVNRGFSCGGGLLARS